jgi:hypothetical protein
MRVPHSAALGALPDGTAMTVWEAMLGVSDNTATDLVLQRIDVANVRRLVADAGMTNTELPASVRSVYGAADMHPDGRAEACIAPMRDLIRFYLAALRGDFSASQPPATTSSD